MPNIRSLRTEWVTLLASLYLLIGFNLFLWKHLQTLLPAGMGGVWLGLAFAALMLLAFNLVLTLVAFRFVLKPLLTLLFMSGAGAAYFMNQYGVLIDAGMFRNIAETNVAEVRDLLSVTFALYMLGLGVLPSVLVWNTRIAYRPWPREVLAKLLVSSACVVALGAVALINYQGLSSLFRNHHELHLMLTPSNIVGAAFGYASERLGSAARPFQTYGKDAVRDAAWQKHQRKSLTVLVVGESARAQNFGVLGYARDTTPKLSKESGLLGFTAVHSCGTETAVSVPCMFSGMARKDYEPSLASRREGLLDILRRAGLTVQWRDNQSGCKGTCDRVEYANLTRANDPLLCAEGECHDLILLQNLDTLLDNLEHDTVLVLHQMGSHGPDYYKRYPAGAERFTPVCRSNALNQCSQSEIINTYDNTLSYTDEVLARLIDTLRSHQDRVDTAMIYLSDHGESLGEYNLFLHGTPYMLAPEQQTHIPMLAWFSDSYREDFAVDTECLAKMRDAPLSQDNLFHSMLGLLQVRTEVYKQSLDLFAGCRPWLTARR